MSKLTPYVVGTVGALLVTGLSAAVPGATEPVVGTPKSRQVGIASGPWVDPAARRDDIQAQVIAEALLNRVVPPELALAVAREESNFNPAALSLAGARGVMQVMPATARDYGVGRDDLWNARINIRVGISYLTRLYEQYGRNWEMALSHYNGGTLDGTATGNPVPHSYTREYVRAVMQRWRTYASAPAVGRLIADVRTALGSPVVVAAARQTAGTRAGLVRSRPVEGAPVALTGQRRAGGLLEDIEQARLSFRRALQAREDADR